MEKAGKYLKIFNQTISYYKTCLFKTQPTKSKVFMKN